MTKMSLIKMVGGTQYVHGDAVDAKIAEKDAEIEVLMNVANDAHMAEAYYKSVNHELVGIHDKQKARIAFLEKALEQAIDAGSLDIVTVVEDKSFDMWRYVGVECIVGQSATENFFAGHPEDSPELAAYLRERDNKEEAV